MYDAFVAYGLQYLLHKRRMKFYRKMYAAALLCEFLQHVGRILNAYFPKGKLAEIFLTAVQCGMPHREGVRRLLCSISAFAMEVPTNTTIQDLNGVRQYIKIYTVAPDTDPQSLIDDVFEYDGYTYTYSF